MTRPFLTKSTTVSLWARKLIRDVGVGYGLKRVDKDRGALFKLDWNRIHPELKSQLTKNRSVTQNNIFKNVKFATCYGYK